MVPLAGFSRRALVAAAAVAAVAPGAAQTRRKRRPKPPLAIVSMTMTNARNHEGPGGPGFVWDLSARLYHLPTATSYDFSGFTGIAIDEDLTAAKARAQILQTQRNQAVSVLSTKGITVTADRVEVILL